MIKLMRDEDSWKRELKLRQEFTVRVIALLPAHECHMIDLHTNLTLHTETDRQRDIEG